MAEHRGGSGRRIWLAVAIVVIVAAAAVALGYRVQHSRAKSGAVQAAQLWTCPMHPSVQLPHPGNCPICGMKLVPMEQAEPKVKSEVEGHGVVEIAPDKQQLIGVVTTKAAVRELRSVIRAAGQVVVDEERLSDIHVKVEGWIEKLHVSKTGQVVHSGQPLLTIYSPDLVSTQEEYLVALRSRERTKGSPFAEVRLSGDSLVAAARRRLELWDISAAEIARLDRTGEVKKELTLYAPSSGYVMEKMAVAGMRVMPEMTLYRLADLSRVWVDVSVYEYEAPLLRVGERAMLTMAAHPGKEFSGRVSYVYPTLETMTRTLRARVEFANPGLMLKPGMYADVVIEAAAGKALAIPEQALLDSGTRKIVFVKQGEGTFVPREVTVGARAVGYYPVLTGLSEGEEVVSSPNFLIDSESRLQAAIQQGAAKRAVSQAPPSKPAAEHEGH
jgi:Cu(I)/Ag(I) efflux system membrane fusion protein